jgi:hypothetical protein
VSRVVARFVASSCWVCREKFDHSQCDSVVNTKIIMALSIAEVVTSTSCLQGDGATLDSCTHASFTVDALHSSRSDMTK